MKKASTVFLRIVIILIGILVLATMIRLPLTEGRAVNLDLFSIYDDPFILYGYLASIAFFVALYQAFKLLGYVDQNRIFSTNSVSALRTIKYCTIILSASIVLAGLYIMIFHDGNDDPAGFLAMCIVTTFISVVLAIVAAVFERTLQRYRPLKLLPKSPE